MRKLKTNSQVGIVERVDEARGSLRELQSSLARGHCQVRTIVAIEIKLSIIPPLNTTALVDKASRLRNEYRIELSTVHLLTKTKMRARWREPDRLTRVCVRKSESGSELLRLVGQWWNEEKRKEGRGERERERRRKGSAKRRVHERKR